MFNLILLSYFFACSGGEETPAQEVTKAEVKTEAPAKPTANPKAEQLQKQVSTNSWLCQKNLRGSKTIHLKRLHWESCTEKALSINDSQSYILAMT